MQLKVLGYRACKIMHRVMCVVDRVVNVLQTRAQVFYNRDK